MRMFLPLLSVLLLSACGASANFESADTGAAFAPTDPGDTGIDTKTVTGGETAAFYAMDGELVLQDGEIEPDLSTLDLRFVSETETILCSETLQVVIGTSDVLDDPTVPVYGWWSMTTDTSTCGAYLQENLQIGIGAWDPQLEPAAIAANLYGGSLYGLYTQAQPSDPVFVFGAAGTSAQFNGAEPPVSYGPLPNGTYQLRSLYLLPLTP